MIRFADRHALGVPHGEVGEDPIHLGIVKGDLVADRKRIRAVRSQPIPIPGVAFSQDAPAPGGSHVLLRLPKQDDETRAPRDSRDVAEQRRATYGFAIRRAVEPAPGEEPLQEDPRITPVPVVRTLRLLEQQRLGLVANPVITRRSERVAERSRPAAAGAGDDQHGSK